MQIEATELPESHTDFAREVAGLAEKYGMDSFEMTYRPHWRNNDNPPSNLTGEIKIRYKATDDRGRPGRDLNIEFEARLKKRVGPKITI